ncbi:MAG: Sec-independent protein translocase protein TatB [Rhodocyclaceae bacterium]|nr:MAG: Sec-independent protein translocase subunit TatB [Rhodocyclaceae bacterium]MBE7424288.1 Sec-independent protein translocase subunit TatB [Zoogloeaceae bacterium]MBV6408510.1 Sec-independent protein translocase protein TatB [Rhodocyclaceae bacterium]MCK6384482.1 Sec-independent protein translocase protein TatB [Rhodocyclaceae bacterium]CAG0932942.1 Sec-independent protein translocase protein TatB [Rhodocyclaceae bacterium]
MFDIGFSELMVIALVALVVIGPERLPRVARTAGHLLGRLQRYVSDVKTDINREIQLEELKKMQQQVEDSARNLQSSVTQEFTSLESTLNQSLAQADAPSPDSESIEAAVPFEPPPPLPEAPAAAPQMELGLEAEQAAKKTAA